MRRAPLLGKHLRLGAALLLGALLLLSAEHAAAQDRPSQTVPMQAPAPAFGLRDVVQKTLRSAPTVHSAQAQVRAGRGRLRAAAGAFDPRLSISASGGVDNTLYTQLQQQSLGVSKANTGLANYRLGLRKQFCSGLTVQPYVSLSRTDALTLDAMPVLRKKASLLVTYPLLRGRGRNAAAAEVEAARRSLGAAHMDLRHTTAQSLTRAAYAYWNYRAAYRRLRILVGAEDRARTLLRNTEALVAGGARPEANLDPLRANLADKGAARISAEQALREARRAVGLAMGLPSERIGALSAPADSFPQVPETLALPTREALVALALARRADLRSAHEQVQAANALLEAGRSEAKPRLDLQVDVGYVGLSEGRGLSVYQHAPPFGQGDVSGATVSVGLRFAWPLGNDGARGRLAQREAAYRQRRIASGDLKRRIRSGVAAALDMLQSARAALEQRRTAVHFYRTAVEDEKKKLRHGMSTLLDVTTVENRLTGALLGRISSQVQLAKALVRLRFETGTLLLPAGDAARPSSRAQRLMEIPLQRN